MGFGILSLATLTNFARTMLDWVRGDMKLEPMEVVEERAQICATCPRNAGYGGCQDCRTEEIPVEVKLHMLLASRRTTVDEKLKHCRQCGCRIALKIQLPAHAFARDKFEYPSHCWMNKL
jgi:hypothetical protein